MRCRPNAPSRRVHSPPQHAARSPATLPRPPSARILRSERRSVVLHRMPQDRGRSKLPHWHADRAIRARQTSASGGVRWGSAVLARPWTDRASTTREELRMERRTYTVTEAATALGISRTSAYERVRAGELPAPRLARRILITRAV